MTTLRTPAKQDAGTNRFRPTGDPKGRHSGEDYGWASGDQILAAAPGTIESVYDDDGYNLGWGNRIVIKHASGVYTTYNHVRPGGVLVKEGQQVYAGQLIGWMGTTGKVTAKHLHFELEVGGRGSGFRVDPRPYFKKDLPGTGSTASSNDKLTAKQRKVRKLGTKNWLNGRADAKTSAKEEQKLEPGTIGNFDGWKHGQKVTIQGITSDIWFRGAFKGNWFASAGFESQSTDGLTEIKSNSTPAPTPTPSLKKRYFKSPANGQYWYSDINKALSGTGYNKIALPGNTEYEVTTVSGKGPVEIKVPVLNRKVWVGTKKHPAKTFTK